MAWLDLRRLARRLPFFYGWVIVGCSVAASFARQGGAVATLSVFVTPMTEEFGWSRGGMSGAVSLGGILGALIAPLVGPLVDRRGARAVLVVSTAVVAAAALGLASTASLAWFYLWFGISRMTFSTPFEIGTTAGVAQWFVRRRSLAQAWVMVGATVSLAVMPMAAQLAIGLHGWRAGWLTIAVLVLLVGGLPNLLLMVRRPEDLGLEPDGGGGATAGRPGPRRPAAPERGFTAREALRTPAAWLLMGYTLLIFPVQAGMSLHQAPHMIERGMSPAVAASIVATFSMSAALASLGFGVVAVRVPVRFGLSAAALVVALGAVFMTRVDGAATGYVAAALFGAGIGGLLTLLPVAWAEYFGRAHFGAIRGMTLPVQVVGQAAGPLLGGVLHDIGGSYQVAFTAFAGFAAAAAVLAACARPPRPAGAAAPA